MDVYFVDSNDERVTDVVGAVSFDGLRFDFDCENSSQFDLEFDSNGSKATLFCSNAWLRIYNDAENSGRLSQPILVDVSSKIDGGFDGSVNSIKSVDFTLDVPSCNINNLVCESATYNALVE